MPPRIITARSVGLEFVAGRLARMGPETSVVGHYSATPRARTTEAGIAAARSFHQSHLNRGWAGIGYHYLIPDTGAIICCRSTFHQGAHVEGHNKGRIGVNMPGTLGDRPTRRQARAFSWLLHNAHTDAMPRLHRTDNDLGRVDLTVHNKLMQTSCPGLFRGMYLRGGDPWVEPSGDSLEPPDDGFVDLTPEDSLLEDEFERGELSDVPLDGTGPDEEELESGADDALELPEEDPDFDEDLSELLAELEPETPPSG
jgi:hypothetical protein